MTRRIDRISAQLKSEISDIITRELNDPRIGFVTITSVKVSNDLRHARVYVTVLGDNKIKAETLAGLRSASRFIRGEIGHRLRIKFIPHIKFEIDTSLEKTTNVLNTLDKLMKEREGEK